jgi:flagellar biosynthesis/type III secretory pathway chaperone
MDAERGLFKDQLLALFDEQLQHLEMLSQHLHGTSKCLTTGDPSGLETLLNEELVLIGKLDALTKQQSALLETRGFGGDRKGVEAAIDWCAPGGEPRQIWHAIQGIVESCREQNQFNATLAQRAEATTRDALAILQGQVQEAAGYGPQGKTLPQPASRRLARA